MSAVKTLALGMILWAVVDRPAQADPIAVSPWKWTTWVRGRGRDANREVPVVPDFSSVMIPTLSALDPPAQPSVQPSMGMHDHDAPAMSTMAAATSTMAAATSTIPIASTTSVGRVERADAYLDMAAPPYAEESILTRGGAQPWYVSPVVTKVFGGQPSAEQQAEFSRQVLDRVDHTYSLSGLSPRLTLDPSVPTSHTLSVVSNTAYGPNLDAIGIADVGGSGFSFIDKLDGVNTVDELSWAVAHNVAHELLHAWGMGDHPDKSGAYLDSAVATWSLLTDPNAKISPAAIEQLLAGDSQLAQRSTSGLAAQMIEGGGPISPQPVPEPTTLAFWSCASIAVVLRYRRSAA